MAHRLAPLLKQYTLDFITEKVDEWSHEIDTFAGIARVHPHPAYTAYTHGQANKWVYQARLPDDCADQFWKLESTIRTKLLPAVCNRTPSDTERELMELPTRLGRLGAHDPAEMAKTLHQGAVRVTELLVNHILQHQVARTTMKMIARLTKPLTKRSAVNRATKRQREEWDTSMQEKAKALCERLGHDSTAALAMRWAEESGTSTWLTALPLVSHGFNLTRREFYDALFLRYRACKCYVTA